MTTTERTLAQFRADVKSIRSWNPSMPASRDEILLEYIEVIEAKLTRYDKWFEGVEFNS